MRFLTYLEELKANYPGPVACTDNQVCLLGPEKERPLVAEHTIFPPMPEEVMRLPVPTGREVQFSKSAVGIH